jgi:hypothetical protein
MAVENIVLTKKLNVGTVADIGALAVLESQRDKPRDYVSDRIMRRINKLVTQHLYELPMVMPAKKGEAGDAYVKRLYAEALKRVTGNV